MLAFEIYYCLRSLTTRTTSLSLAMDSILNPSLVTSDNIGLLMANTSPSKNDMPFDLAVCIKVVMILEPIPKQWLSSATTSANSTELPSGLTI